MTLEELNGCSKSQAYEFFEHCCHAQQWIEQMTAHRPYATVDTLCEQGERVWWALNPSDHLQAFAAHPMIGDLSSLKAKYAHTSATASEEQASTALATEETLIQLKQYNERYRDIHGFIFIICATGLSAEAMLEALKARIDNHSDVEMRLAAAEQIKITLLRIRKGIVNHEERS